jgi:hypothetical protein
MELLIDVSQRSTDVRWPEAGAMSKIDSCRSRCEISHMTASAAMVSA